MLKENMPLTVRGKLLEANALLDRADQLREDAWDLRRAALEQKREEMFGYAK